MFLMKVRNMAGLGPSLCGFLIIASLSVLISCSYYIDKAPTLDTSRSPLTPEEKAQLSYQMVREKVFAPRCVSCHGSAGGLSVDSYESIKANLSAIERAALVTNTMPKGGVLTSEEARLLRAWIDAGAPFDVRPGDSQPPHPPHEPESPVPAELSYEFVKANVFGPRCLMCHGTEGGVSLETFTEVKARMKDIVRAALIEKTMPKGKALTSREYEILLNWVAAGAPMQAPSSSSDDESATTPGGSTSPTPNPSPNPTPLALEPTFVSIKANILDTKCLSCHSNSGSARHIPLGTKDDILNSPRDLAVPGNADESGLVIAIERQDEKRMPPPQTGLTLTDDEKHVVRKWVENGAKD